MRDTMRLLLLLSAFLTALVGVGASASAAVRPACAATASVSVGVERKCATPDNVARLESRVRDHVGVVAFAPQLVPVSMVPLYLGRLRV